MASGDVLSRDVRGETVLLDLRTEQYFGLEGVAARVWQLIGSGATMPELVGTVVAEFDVSEDTAARDVERLVATLLEAGLVVSESARLKE